MGTRAADGRGRGPARPGGRRRRATASPATPRRRRRHVGLCTTKVGRPAASSLTRHPGPQRQPDLRRSRSERGMPAHAATIALAAALQESKLYNLRGGDRDSLGLFQQRPSQGWGTPQRDPRPGPRHQRLLRRAGPGATATTTLPVTVAAQRGAALGLPLGVRRLRDRRAGPGVRADRLLPRRVRLPPDARPRRSPAPAARRAAAVRRTLAPAFGRSEVSVADGSRVQIAAASAAAGLGDRVVPRRPRPGLG